MVGKCISVVAPGAQGTKVNSRGKEMAHGTRLYSIAATRYGDKLDGKTTTLCVRRVRPARQPPAGKLLAGKDSAVWWSSHPLQSSHVARLPGGNALVVLSASGGVLDASKAAPIGQGIAGRVQEDWGRCRGIAAERSKAAHASSHKNRASRSSLGSLPAAQSDSWRAAQCHAARAWIACAPEALRTPATR